MPSMALPASAALLAWTPKFQSKLFERRLNHVGQQIYSKCSRKVIVAQIGEPNKVKVQLRIGVEKLWASISHPVKKFPWKKAEIVLLERLLFLGKKALKWSLVTLLIFSSLSDAVVAIYRNQELMVPLGLLVGCLMADFLKESLQEVFRGSEGKGLHWQLWITSCFFVLVKFISAYFMPKARVILLHAANGGLMQVLWLWGNLVEQNDENSTSNQNASLAIDAED